MRIINVNVGVFDENDRLAAEVRARLEEQKTFMINLMASPGAGKTTLLVKTAEALKDMFKMGVMEADIDASVDAETMEAAGVRSIQVHTGGECAMDAAMTLQAIHEFDTSDLDLLVLENVGNLVCPAETPVGAHKNVVLLSVPEGDDKPLKYPLMFSVADLVIITKVDTEGFFAFDHEALVERVKERNPRAEVIFLSAKTGEGMAAWTAWLKREIGSFRG